MVDIGANLTHRSFNPDLEGVVSEFFDEKEFTAIVITGTSIQGSWNAHQIVDRFHKPAKPRRNLFSTVGIHPHDAKSFNEDAQKKLERYIQFSYVVAVGECGLDYNRMFSTKEQQKRCFRFQIELAIKLKLPLFLHERDAFDDFIEILDEYRDGLEKINVVVHCFTGTVDQAKEYVSRGFYIGVTGWISDKRRNSSLLEAVKYVPTDKLMVETDSPFLSPTKSKRNTPSNLEYVIRDLAKALNQDPELIKKVTRKTSIKFFNLPIDLSKIEGEEASVKEALRLAAEEEKERPKFKEDDFPPLGVSKYL